MKTTTRPTSSRDLFSFLDMTPAALRLLVIATVYTVFALLGVGCAVDGAGTGDVGAGGSAGSVPIVTSTGGSAPVSTGGATAVGGAGGSVVTSTGGAAPVSTGGAPASTGGAGGSAPVLKANGAACDVSSACSSGLCCFVGGLGNFCAATRLGCDSGGGVTYTKESRPETGIDVPCRAASDCPTVLVTADKATLGCVGFMAKTRTSPEALGYCSR